MIKIDHHKKQKRLSESQRYKSYDSEKEPIKAYLRIRPKPDHHQGLVEQPYIDILDDHEVIMTPPKDSRTRNKTPERYRFTRVFRDADQSTFFDETCLNLVEDVLNGKNTLVFAYGVTNSGKTFTMLGKEGSDAGLLPRALSTLFHSIQGLESEVKIKPVMHCSLQSYTDPNEENRHLCQTLEEKIPSESTKLQVDTHSKYAVWVFFVEIYNEQVFDLLPNQPKQTKRQPLVLKYDQRTGHKYAADANLIKINTVQEAYGIIQQGQKNRQVFSTLMNQSSSRSHSIFTVHLIKSNEEGASLSKFSLVDLAGSERYRNTNSTGQRLKEAGNINKSLMVLGQCMEVLRINQIKADMGKNAALVPFRHSKLTELFKSTFEGDGKAVIVVNVNPFDTGYDENIHVMRFAAVAKDVMTSLQPSKKQKDLMAQLEDLWDKWADAETRASTIEHEVREQMETELKKTHDLYLAALKRETDMMQSHINDRLQDTPDDTFLTMLQERQTVLSKELDDINIKIKQQQDTMRDRINQLEKERNLLLEHPKQRAYNPSEDEQEPEHKENQDLPTYHQFLDLRKQLRRLIFKKEELCKDADLVMKQVEQFEGVTFQMAKETKMGKLLKLIAQEEFKSDPFYIKNRAIRLFKRYAQLPCPKQPLYDNESANDLEAENVRLKQKIKLLQYNQRRLQEELDETPAMMEDDDEKENEDTSSFNDEEDIAQLFRPKGVKRRRKLRVR